MEIGSLLAGRYRLDDRIGAGGMGTVWRAFDTTLERIVAVKTLRPELAADDRLRARFKREARSVAALSHPGIVAVHDAGDDTTGSEPVPFLVMELIQGRALSELLAEDSPMRPAAAVDLVIAAAEAVAAAHRAGIVHRDIKPGNLMVAADGAVTVTDFGIAHVDGAGDLTMPGMVMGTAAYAAPEQLRGEEAGPACDIYSLGVVLRECLTGSPSTTATVPGSVSAELMAVVATATAVAPADRYASAEELAASCRAALSSLDGSGSGELSASSAPAGRRGTGWLVATVTLTMVAVVLALVAGYLVVRPPDRASAAALSTLSSQHRSAIRTATAAYEAMTTYDYRSFDADTAAAEDYLVDGASEEFRATVEQIHDQVVTDQTIATGTVLTAGISPGGTCAVTGTECVAVLVFADLSVRSRGTREQVDQVRVRLDLVPSGSVWKVMAVRPV